MSGECIVNEYWLHHLRLSPSSQTGASLSPRLWFGRLSKLVFLPTLSFFCETPHTVTAAGVTHSCKQRKRNGVIPLQSTLHVDILHTADGGPQLLYKWHQLFYRYFKSIYMDLTKGNCISKLSLRYLHNVNMFLQAEAGYTSVED